MEGASQLVGTVGQLLGEEYRLLSRVGGEVVELRHDLATMNAILRMQSEAEDGAVDHFVREWMNQLRELAYDAEDSADLYKLRIKSRPHEGVRSWLGRLLETLLPRHRLSSEIKALRARAIAISDRHARYGDALRRSPSPLLQNTTAPAPMMGVASEESSAHDGLLRSTGDNNPAEPLRLTGVKMQAETMIGWLTNDKEPHRSKMFPIVGFGGVGKTTLAMEVCKLLEDVFPYQAMVSVSQAFDPTKDIKALLDRVLQQIVKPKKEIDKGIKEEGTTLQGSDVVDKLKNFLDGKRYLIVIDDVWTRRAWEAIRAKLPADNKHDCQGRIIITTRIEAVATACCPNRDCILRVKPLNTADSNKLLLTKVFGSEDASYPSQLEAVMGSILKRCGGLPLAIVSIASVLAGHKSAESIGKWVRVNNSIGSLMESNPTLEGMRHIITLSYNHLPYELKSCIMYLSMFPEDYEIDTDRLLCRWIAEGLVPEKRGLTLMEVAESYLEDLVSRNMIQRYAGWHYDELCRVHDMLLEVMVSKSLESNFVSLLGGPYAGISYDRIRRLSIHGAVARTNKKAAGGRHGSRRHGSFQEMDVKHVRSLSTFVEAEPEAGHHSLQLLDQLGKFTLLRVLDLENCKEVTDKHMSSICRLYLLKFLNLKGTGITLVPPQVGKLEHLQSFDVRDTRVQELPQTMTNLEKLERIMSPEKAGWEPVWRLPQGLSNMKALRQVAGSFLGNDVQVAQELGELQQLQKLLIYMRRADSSDELLDMLAESLCKLSTLQALNIAEIGNEHGNLLNFLHRLQQPPRLLRYLRMFGGMEGSPPWVDSLVNLTVFEIANGVSIDTDRLFDALGNLPCLEVLLLWTVRYSGGLMVAGSRHIFPALRNFSMSLPYNTELREIQFQEGSMANLKTLIVRLGPNEVGMVGSKHLKNLKEVHITGPRNSRPFNCAIEELKAESASRPESSRFEVSVSYW